MKNNNAYESYQQCFTDFTRANYRQLLKIAKHKYAFSNFDDFIQDGDFIIWRHDIDSSLNCALKLAKIEAEEGIQAYYFIHLHNVLYNPLEPEMSDIIRAIMSCGHKIGLHFDTAYYDIQDEVQFEKWLHFEAEILAKIYKTEITAFSFHNPTDMAQKCTSERYAGLINTTSEYFRNKVGYCSDSNGYWRYRRLEDVLLEASDKRLQVLTHPEWWQESVMSPKERIWRCIDGRSTRTKQWYDSILIKYGRKNIDWVKT